MQSVETIPSVEADSQPQQIMAELKKMCLKQLKENKTSNTKVFVLMQEISKRLPGTDTMSLVWNNLKFDGKEVELELELDNVGDSTTIQESLEDGKFFTQVEVKRRNILPDNRARITYRLKMRRKGSGTNACI